MKTTRGFTLIELMVTISVAVIILTAGVPAFQGLVARNKAVTETNKLVSLTNVARSEAITRGLPVIVCPSADGTSCTGAWAQGRLAYVDADLDSTLDAGETFRVQGPVTSGVALTSAATELRFLPSGMASATSGGATFTLTPNVCDGQEQRQITVLPSGQASTVYQSCP